MARLMRWLSIPLVVAALCVASLALLAQTSAMQGEWRHYSGDNGSKKYAPLAQIDKGNVSRLRVAWRRPQISSDFMAANPKLRLSNNYRSTPIMVGGLLYATNAVGLVEAFDPATGGTIWSQRSDQEESGNPGLGGALRAVAFWGEGDEARVFSYHRQFLYALHPKTGAPIATFGAGGRVDLAALSTNNQFLWNAPPLVVRDLVLVGSSMPDQDSATKAEGEVGEVRAFDARTGRAALALPRHSERRRPGREIVGERRAPLHRRGQRVGADERRRGARLRLPADVEPDQRHVRRSPTRQQPLHEQRRLPRRNDRPARVALSDRPPRPLRLRQPGSADSGRHHRQRTPDPRGRPGHQAGVRLRAGSRDRRAGVADRGAAGAGLDGARREGGADAAVSDEAAAVRSSGRDRSTT